MPHVRVYVRDECEINETKLHIACWELIAAGLHVEDGKGALSPYYVSVILLRVKRLDFDVIIDIEALPYVERYENRQARTSNIRGSIESLFDNDFTVNVVLKLNLTAESSMTSSAEPKLYDNMSIEAAEERARRRFKHYDETGDEDLELQD